jgi:hypothetical protein
MAEGRKELVEYYQSLTPEKQKEISSYGLWDAVKEVPGRWANWRKKQWPFRDMTELELGESAAGFVSMLKPMAIQSILAGSKYAITRPIKQELAGVARRIFQTPQRELRRLRKVDVNATQFPAEYGSGGVRGRSISFDARGKYGDFTARAWWHELDHLRSDLPRENILEMFDTNLRARITRRLQKQGITPQQRGDYWDIAPDELHADLVAEMMERTTRGGLPLPTAKMTFNQAFTRASRFHRRLFDPAADYLSKPQLVGAETKTLNQVKKFFETQKRVDEFTEKVLETLKGKP